MLRFSILIPTWNNLNFLKLCVQAIRENSATDHQIIIHVNGGGTDGTLQWVKNEGLDYTFSEDNIGVCWAMNLMRTKVKTDYICYLNDDMYVLPGWDVEFSKAIEESPDNRFFFSGTIIQPFTPCNDGVSGIRLNDGTNLENFEKERLLSEYKQLYIDDWQGATMPPNIVHRDTWDYVGGYSIEFFPGLGSDPDFTTKLWVSGVRLFKGLGKSLTYHFEGKSTGRVRRNDGTLQYLLKWGISQRVFRRNVERRGAPYDASKSDAIDKKLLRREAAKYRFKTIFLLLRRKLGPINSIWE